MSEYDLNKQVSDVIEKLVDINTQIYNGQFEIKSFENFHPRAVKLFRKRKNFLVVSEDEPYALDVYNMIRKQEKLQGTWSDDDERIYQTFANNYVGEYP